MPYVKVINKKTKETFIFLGIERNKWFSLASVLLANIKTRQITQIYYYTLIKEYELN